MTSSAQQPPPLGIAAQEIARATDRASARAHNEALSYPGEDEAALLFAATRSADPYPEIPPALLNSADIIDYVRATGMVTPFHPNQVKTASYGVALLGPWRYRDGAGNVHKGDLKRDEEFTLKANSIAFMTVEPRLRVPDYIGLRHNLKINHVYKGLLVGTGPLIDPGFVGRLSLPLHNLTEQDYVLRGGEEIIWIEFTKLSSNPRWIPAKAQHSPKREGRYAPFKPQDERNVDEYIFQATLNAGIPSSSSAQIDKRSRDAVDIARDASVRLDRFQARLRNISIAGALFAALAVVAAVAGLIVPIEVTAITQINDQTREIEQLRERLEHISPSATATPLPSGLKTSKTRP